MLAQRNPYARQMQLCPLPPPFFPLLLPTTLVKPQTGLQVMLAYRIKRGYLASVVVFLTSLLVDPHWPRLWMANLHDYVQSIPLLLSPGPPGLALLRFRHRNARLMFRMSVMPQRWFCDARTLWLVVRITP